MRYLSIVFVIFILPFLCFFPYRGLLHNSYVVDYTDSFNYCEDSANVVLPIMKSDGVYTLSDTIDLQNKTWYLPDNITLNVDKGLIRNGVIVGKNTKLAYKGVIFDKVHVEGTWIVPDISSSMFADLSYDNALKEVFALANPNVNNVINVDYGIYSVSALNNFDNCLKIVSNTEIVMDGNILLSPNSFTDYSILYLNGDNIIIRGEGTIMGDKNKHIGNTGEWGMGVYVNGGNNIRIYGLVIKDCWGDCIYITGKAKDVLIENCFLDQGRRQGISVISATNVNIRDCVISNVGGTSPQYAIDVEPNANDTVKNVCIDEVNVINCQGGIMCYGRAINSEISLIKMNGCVVEGTKLCPVFFDKGRNVIVENTKIIGCDYFFMIVCDGVDSVSVYNNSICYNNKNLPLIDRVIVANNSKFKRIHNNVIY